MDRLDNNMEHNAPSKGQQSLFGEKVAPCPELLKLRKENGFPISFEFGADTFEVKLSFN